MSSWNGPFSILASVTAIIAVGSLAAGAGEIATVSSSVLLLLLVGRAVRRRRVELEVPRCSGPVCWLSDRVAEVRRRVPGAVRRPRA